MFPFLAAAMVLMRNSRNQRYAYRTKVESRIETMKVATVLLGTILIGLSIGYLATR